MAARPVMRGIILLDPQIQEINRTVPDPTRWFRLEEDLLNLGIDDRSVRAIVFEAIDAETAIAVRSLNARPRRVHVIG